MSISNRTRGTLMVVVGAIIMSFEGLLIRQVSVDRWTMICWRGFFVFSTLSIGMIVCWRRRFLSRFFAIGWTGVIAAVIMAIGNICFVTAFTLTSISNTLVITNAAPLIVALFSWLLLRERVPGRTWIAILVGLGGIVVIFHGGLMGDRGRGPLRLWGCYLLAAYIIFMRYAREINMLPSLALTGLLFTLFVFPAARPFPVSGSDLGLFFLIGGISCAGGMGLVTLAPRYIPATEVGLLKLLEAVLGATWAWMIISEYPGLESLLGGAMVIGALVFNSLVGWKKG